MNTNAQTIDSGKIARFSTKMSFFTAGIATAPWASIIPYVKERLELNEAIYASMILCFGLGAVIGMPLTGKLVALIRVKKVILVSFILINLAMMGLSFSHINLPLAYIFVIFWGMSLGVFDVANNIHGAYVEELTGKRLMSGFHAWYTMGCLFSAILCAVLLPIGFSTFFLTSFLAVIGVVCLAQCFNKLINTDGKGALSGSDHLSPNSAEDVANTANAANAANAGNAVDNTAANTAVNSPKVKSSYITFPIIMLGFMCLVMYLTEGMVYDWSGVYLITIAMVPIEIASIGYLAFQTAVAIMRFMGDRLVGRIGARRLITTGSVIAAVALFLIAFSHNAIVIVACYLVAGLCLANVVPVMLSETAHRSGENQGKAIAFVGTLGYSGLLLGPGLLGGVASVFNLPAMFILVGSLVALLALTSFIMLHNNTKAPIH